MKLIRADGHQQQQWALANIQAQTVARIFSEHIDDDYDLLKEVALVLQKFHGDMYDGLAQKLASIRAIYKPRESEESSAIPDYVTELLQSLHELYYQPRSVLYPTLKDQINSLRGAVVELVGLALIKSRYHHTDECANSRRFVDQRNKTITLQEIDIAAFSHGRRQLEGYECKMKAIALENHDCVDLEYLYCAAVEEDYQAQVGVISFDHSKLVEKRLRALKAAPCIQAYGVDVFNELQYSPFE